MSNKQQIPDEGLLKDYWRGLEGNGALVTDALKDMMRNFLAKAKPILIKEGYKQGVEDANKCGQLDLEEAKKQVEEEMLEVLNKEYPVRAIWQRYLEFKERNNE